MGALLLCRQLGGALSLAAAETVYVGQLRSGASPEAATGMSIFVVAATGAVIAMLALLTLRRGADRIPAPNPNLAVSTRSSTAEEHSQAVVSATS
jgi:hypothetical protein